MNIKVYERVELKLRKKPLSTILINENGEGKEIEPFLYQPIKLQYDDEGIEKTVKTGEAYYMIRFTVFKEGKYLLQNKYENENDETEIIAKDFYNNGFVQISEKDKRYFSYSNGKPFFPVAVNICFPRRITVSNNLEFGKTDDICFIGMRQYERWFKKCAENGVNMVRIWLGHEYFSPDTENAYEFDYSQFSKIDILLALAKKHRIKLKFTFEQFRYFDYDDSKPKDNTWRSFCKRLYIDGNRCESIDEWTTNEIWKNAWLNKIKEFAKRYADDTEIFAFELWNEMNCLPNTNQWNLEMLPKAKKMFPNNFVINSLGSLDCQAALTAYKTFPWELSEFKQVHRYLDQGAEMESTRHNPIDTVREGLKLMSDGKTPIIIAETGAVHNCHSDTFKYYSTDDRGTVFVDCVYTPVFCESAACGNIWHWDERYIESKNLYKYFSPLAELLKDIDFPSENFKAVDLSDDNTYLYILKGDTQSIGFIRNKTDNWKNVLRDMKEPTAVSIKEMDFNCDNVRQIKIWDDDTTKISTNNGKIYFENILYGTLFTIT